VTVTGPTLAGKTEALLRLADALGGIEGLEISLVLAGTRPEELAVWAEHGLAPVGSALLGASPEAQAQVVEQAVEQAKRQAARGTHAVLIVDSLEQLQLTAARRRSGPPAPSREAGRSPSSRPRRSRRRRAPDHRARPALTGLRRFPGGSTSLRAAPARPICWWARRARAASPRRRSEELVYGAGVPPN
jgi:hypothetical protein